MVLEQKLNLSGKDDFSMILHNSSESGTGTCSNMPYSKRCKKTKRVKFSLKN